MVKWERSATATGAPLYIGIGTPFAIEAEMSRSRIVGSAKVFGVVVSEGDHRPKPVKWWVVKGSQAVQVKGTLAKAKAYVESKMAQGAV